MNPTCLLRRSVMAAVSFGIAATVVSIAVAEDALRARLAPPPRLNVPAPATTREAAPDPGAPLVRRPYLPVVSVAVQPRALTTTPRATLPPVPSDAAPAPVRAKLPVPSQPQFERPARVAVARAAKLTPRIPNLLGNPRRQQWSTANPIVVPAAAVSTPTVNNLDGTQALAPLSPFHPRHGRRDRPAPRPARGRRRAVHSSAGRARRRRRPGAVRRGPRPARGQVTSSPNPPS